MRKFQLFVGFVALPLTALFACTDDSITSAPPVIDASAADVALPKTDAAQLHETGTDATPDASVDAPEAGDSTAPDAADTGADSADSADSADAADSADSASDVDAAASGPGGVRLANLAPDGVAVDFCVAKTGSAFTTPYMKSVGVNAGVAYAQVSEYAAASLGSTYKARVVAAGAADCSTPLAGLADVAVPEPTTDNPVTVALLGIDGDALTPLSLQVLVDEGASTAPTVGLRLRILHAAPDQGATAFQVGAGAWVVGLQDSIAYGHLSGAATTASGAPTPDAAGYLTSAADSAQITARQASLEITSSYDGEERTSSIFFVGNSTSATSPLGMLECDDTKPAAAHFSVCPLRTGPPTFHKLRFLDLAPDSPTVDVCLTVGAIGQPGAPMLSRSAISPMSFLSMSGQLTDFPDWTGYGAWFIAAGDTCDGNQIGGGIGSALLTLDGTIFLTETAFAPAAQFTLGVDSGDFVDVNDPGMANLSLVNDVYLTGGETIQAYIRPNAGTEVTLFGSLPPRNLAFFAPNPAGLYNFRVTDATTTAELFAVNNVILGAPSNTSLHFFALTASTRSLARCDLAEPPAGTLVTCQTQ